MSEFFDYDPLTGVTTTFDFDDLTGISTLHHKQDLQPVLDWTKRMRDHTNVDKGIKEDWWHYAVIPTIIEMQLLKKGINIHEKNDQKRVLREINQNYPYLKLTYKHHE